MEGNKMFGDLLEALFLFKKTRAKKMSETTIIGVFNLAMNGWEVWCHFQNRVYGMHPLVGDTIRGAIQRLVDRVVA